MNNSLSIDELSLKIICLWKLSLDKSDYTEIRAVSISTDKTRGLSFVINAVFPKWACSILKVPRPILTFSDIIAIYTWGFTVWSRNEMKSLLDWGLIGSSPKYKIHRKSVTKNTIRYEPVHSEQYWDTFPQNLSLKCVKGFSLPQVCADSA